MQALKDAGILLAALTLLASVSVSPVAEDDEAETSLTPRTEASAPVRPAPAAVVPPVEADAGAFEVRFDGDLAERCEEVLVLFADVAAEHGREAVAHRIRQVVRQQPCQKT